MMSINGKNTTTSQPPPPDAAGDGGGGGRRLRLNPNLEHEPDNYEDLEVEFSPLLFSALERYLPPSLLSVPRETKLNYMNHILLRYSSKTDRLRVEDVSHTILSPADVSLDDGVNVSGLQRSILHKHKEYRQKIISNYKPLHCDLYTMNGSSFFIPSFLKAISENTEESFRSIMKEDSPGIFTFEMLQPKICAKLVEEVENFEKWVHETRFRIMRPNTMNKYGAVLDDFGLESMLEKLMDDFIRPISKVFFSEVGGATLDSHHGFVVEYGTDKDIDLGFHVDDSEVTLNICLGKQFTGGELFFRGVRCEKHVNTETQPEESKDYPHVPGRAILHRGRHRHGARATTGGHRLNLLVWCRSSVFRELRKYQKDFSSWCAECDREKKQRQHKAITTTKLELLRREEAAS